MATTDAELAAAIRRNLMKLVSSSDEELVARDTEMHRLFQQIAEEAVFFRPGARAFESLALLITGSPLPLSA